MRKADAVRDKSWQPGTRTRTDQAPVPPPPDQPRVGGDLRRASQALGEVGAKARTETRDEIARMLRRAPVEDGADPAIVADQYADMVADAIRQPPAATDRTITRNVADVTKPVSQASEAGRKLTTALENNAGAEARALAALSPAQQSAYRRLAAATTGDVAARLGLQVLLLGDRLPGQASSGGGADTLAGLDRLLTKAPLAEGIDRNALVRQLVREMAAPAAIAQKGKNTCTVTSLQIFMADRRPSEYVRIVTALASPEGAAVLTGGPTVRREPGTAADDGSGRSISSRLWQPAMMEAANGRDYDNAADNFDGDPERRGLNVRDIGRVFKAVTGDRVISRDVRSLPLPERERFWKKLLGDSLGRGDAVLVGLEWTSIDAATGKENTSGHKVLVTGFDAGVVHFTNPWGQEEIMSVRDFTQRLKNLNVLVPENAD